MGAGKLADAERDLRQALELAPNHPAALNDLAVLLLEQGRRDEARSLLEHLVRIQPGNQAARRDLAYLEGH